jgi:hypothetical protein
MTKHILIAGAALLALAGCGRGGEANGQADANVAATAAAGKVTVTDVGDPDGERQDGPSLLLAADGIMPGGTEQSMIPFGANSLDTIEQVTPLLGNTYDEDESSECGAGPMEFANWGKVVLMFQSGEFVGWELREASDKPYFGTPGGLTIGSPRSELDAALPKPLKVEQSSLGTEFNAGGFSGLLSDATPSAKVTALWAGTNCAMR